MSEKLNFIILVYMIYIIVSFMMTIWVGRTLHKNGRIFLVDRFYGNEAMADSVNHLFLVGFYLINIGWICAVLKVYGNIDDVRECIEILSRKIGIVLILLGVMHFFNLFLLAITRRRASANVAAHPAPPILT